MKKRLPALPAESKPKKSRLESGRLSSRIICFYAGRFSFLPLKAEAEHFRAAAPRCDGNGA